MPHQLAVGHLERRDKTSHTVVAAGYPDNHEVAHD
jgi:hypothetical protein